MKQQGLLVNKTVAGNNIDIDTQVYQAKGYKERQQDSKESHWNWLLEAPLWLTG